MFSYCTAEDECLRGQGLAQQVFENEQHSFAGYGFYVSFHPECCPGTLDGSRCFQDHNGHPEGWLPADPADYARCT